MNRSESKNRFNLCYKCILDANCKLPCALGENKQQNKKSVDTISCEQCFCHFSLCYMAYIEHMLYFLDVLTDFDLKTH